MAGHVQLTARSFIHETGTPFNVFDESFRVASTGVAQALKYLICFDPLGAVRRNSSDPCKTPQRAVF